MTDLSLHGHPIRTVFDLLGDKENDITYSLGWGLANSDGFAHALTREISRELRVRQPGHVEEISPATCASLRRRRAPAIGTTTGSAGALGGRQHVLVARFGVRAHRARERDPQAAHDGDPANCRSDEHDGLAVREWRPPASMPARPSDGQSSARQSSAPKQR